MAKFILIDQSLRSVGGHPYDYASHLLAAVEKLGYTPLLATHRKFRQKAGLPAAQRTLACFRHSSYSRYALCSSGVGLPRGANPETLASEGPESRFKKGAGPLRRGQKHNGNDLPAKGQTPFRIGSDMAATKKPISQVLFDRWHAWRRESQLKHFEKACDYVFSQFALESGDHVFFPTVSEFDFLALARFLSRFPRSQAAQWHLQFHFGIFEGRPCEYESQENRLEWVRRCFEEALPQVSGLDLRFYNTSLPLVEQYNRLGLVEFQSLAYPINPAMQPSLSGNESANPRPLRITCGGGYRQEKGQGNLATGLSEIWEECFDTGKMQLHVQAKRSKWLGMRLSGKTASSDGSNGAAEHSAVVLIPHPLEVEQYVELIRQSHVGLLMYDSRRYYARRAGVLCEFLCAGVPVIVPAGCWLSEQIAEAGFEYLDTLCSAVGAQQDCVVTADSDEVSQPPSRRVTAKLTVPAGVGEMVVSVPRGTSGEYLRIEVEQFDAAGQSLGKFSHLVGQREGVKPARAMWRIDPQSRSVGITVENAFDHSSLDLDELHLTWLPRAMPRALSAVGLIAADGQHFAKLLREISDHYPHYRQTALAFSDTWRRKHDPALTAAQLTGQQQAEDASSRAA